MSQGVPLLSTLAPPGRPTELTHGIITAVAEVVRQGGYPTVALEAAGLSVSCHAKWLRKAEHDMEQGLETVHVDYFKALKAAERDAEMAMVKCIRDAAQSGPQYWAAAATHLERRHPDRWGRRDESRQGTNAPVQIQIINYHGAQPVPLPAVEIHELPPATSE